MLKDVNSLQLQYRFPKTTHISKKATTCFVFSINRFYMLNKLNDSSSLLTVLTVNFNKYFIFELQNTSKYGQLLSFHADGEKVLEIILY